MSSEPVRDRQGGISDRSAPVVMSLFIGAATATSRAVVGTLEVLIRAAE